MTFRPAYAAATVALFAVETAIALFVHDAVVRPFVGDGLAVVLVYCALRAVTPFGVPGAIAAALTTAFVIEFGQLIGLLDLLGLRTNRLAAVVLGTGFDPVDFAAYIAGASCAVATETIASFRIQQRRG